MLLKMIREQDYKMICNGEYNPSKIKVCYGFDTYKHDVKYINKIVRAIKTNCPNIKECEMMVEIVSYRDSIRHVGYTVIAINIDVDIVRKNFEEYTVL